MARFSIVVPLDRQSACFDETLASVLSNRPDNCQIIVPHFGEYGDPYGLEKEVDFCSVEQPADANGRLATLFNAGLNSARGTLIGFIRPGVRLEEDWDKGLDSIFQAVEVASVIPLLVDGSNETRVLAAGVEATKSYNRLLSACNLNSARINHHSVNPLGPTSWAAFYRKSLLTSLGGFDETIEDTYIDLDLALSLDFLEFQTVLHSELVLRMDNGDSLLQEAAQSHGQSAQRAWARFTDVTEQQRTKQRKQTFWWELLTSRGKWDRCIHAWQRKSADQFLETDSHHQDLLNLLWKQRERLTAPALHLRVAAVRERNQSSNIRRAA